MRTGYRQTALFGIVTMSTLLSCKSKAPTAITVAVSTEGAVPRDMEQLEIVVTRSSDQKADVIRILPSQAALPGTITLQKDGDGPITIEVRGAHKGATPHVIRRATLGFVDEQTKLLRMPLCYICYGAMTCDPGETCRGGDCVSDAVDEGTLPDFTSSDEVDGTPGTCFDESKCFASATPANVDLKQCTIPLPEGATLGVRFKTWPDRLVTVVADPLDGYTLTGGMAKLATGLCNAISAGKITDVFVSRDASCGALAQSGPACPVSSAAGSGGAAGHGGSAGSAGHAGTTGTSGNGGTSAHGGNGGQGGSAGGANHGGASGSSGQGGAGAAGHGGAGGSAGAGTSGMGGIGGSGATAGSGGSGGAIVGFQVVSVSPAPGEIPTGPFTETITFSEDVMQPAGFVKFQSSASIGLSTPGAYIDTNNPKVVHVDIMQTDFVQGIPYLGLVKAGFTSATGDKLLQDYPWSIVTGPELTGSSYPLFSWNNNPVLAISPGTSATDAFILQPSQPTNQLFVGHYVDGMGFIDAHDVAAGLSLVSSGPDAITTDGAGSAFVVFHGQTAQQQMTAGGTTLFLARYSMGAWQPTVTLDSQPYFDGVHVVTSPSGDATLLWSKPSATTGYDIEIADVPYLGSPGAPQMLASTAVIPTPDLAAAGDGSVMATWQLPNMGLHSTQRPAGGAFGAATLVPMSDTLGAEAPVLRAGKTGVYYVLYRSMFSSPTWRAQRFDPANGWESGPFSIYPSDTQTIGALTASIVIDDSGDAVAVARESMGASMASLQCAKNVGGAWTNVTFPTTTTDGWFTLIPPVDTSTLGATVYWRTDAKGTVGRANFDGNKWTTDTAFTLTSTPPFGGSIGQLQGARINGRALVVVQGAGNGTGTLDIYRE